MERAIKYIMPKTMLAIFIALIFIAAGFTDVYFIEKDNSGIFSGMLTLIASLPFLISWVVIGICAALFISLPHSKGARITASILMFIPTGAIGMSSAVLFSQGKDEESMYPILPLCVLTLTYVIGIVAWVKKRPTE